MLSFVCPVTLITAGDRMVILHDTVAFGHLATRLVKW